MTLLAGLAVGVFVYFLVGFLTGYAPEIKIRRFRPPSVQREAEESPSAHTA